MPYRLCSIAFSIVILFLCWMQLYICKTSKMVLSWFHRIYNTCYIPSSNRINLVSTNGTNPCHKRITMNYHFPYVSFRFFRILYWSSTEMSFRNHGWKRSIFFWEFWNVGKANILSSFFIVQCIYIVLIIKVVIFMSTFNHQFHHGIVYF